MTNGSPLPWTMAGDLSGLQSKAWVVQDFLMAGEVAVLVAPPATGKSVLAARIALDVRSGSPFLGHETAEGAALFVAAERERETRLRISTMRGERGDVPVLGPSLAGKIDLRQENAVRRLTATIRDIEITLGQPLRLVVIDTLARCAPGADENSARDMGAIADALSQIAECGPAVLVLHHPSRNGRGVRGSSAIDGAVDRILELRPSRNGFLTLKVVEANAGPSGASVQFRLAPIEIGQDEEGEPITAITVQDLGAAATASSTPSAESVRASVVLELLHSSGGRLSRKELLTTMRARGALSTEMKSSSEQLRRVLVHLKAKRAVDYSDADVTLCETSCNDRNPLP